MTPKEGKNIRSRMSTAHTDHNKGLNKQAFFKMHDSKISEELVQETFRKTLTYLDKGGKIDTMKAFLYHILHDLIVDEYRKNKPSSLDAMLENGFELGVEDPERFLNKLDGKATTLLIGRLPEKYRRVMNLRYVKGLSIKEIALITGQTKNAIAVQAHRGLAKLRVLYNLA